MVLQVQECILFVILDKRMRERQATTDSQWREEMQERKSQIDRQLV